jgi:hypothetical protein
MLGGGVSSSEISRAGFSLPGFDFNVGGRNDPMFKQQKRSSTTYTTSAFAPLTINEGLDTDIPSHFTADVEKKLHDAVYYGLRNKDYDSLTNTAETIRKSLCEDDWTQIVQNSNFDDDAYRAVEIFYRYEKYRGKTNEVKNLEGEIKKVQGNDIVTSNSRGGMTTMASDVLPVNQNTINKIENYNSSHNNVYSNTRNNRVRSGINKEWITPYKERNYTSRTNDGERINVHFTKIDTSFDEKVYTDNNYIKSVDIVTILENDSRTLDTFTRILAETRSDIENGGRHRNRLMIGNNLKT